MSGEKETVGYVAWWLLFYGTLLCLGLIASGNDPKDEPNKAAHIGGVLCFSVPLLASPWLLRGLASLWEHWKRGRPQRELARAVSRERAAERREIEQNKRTEQAALRREKEEQQRRSREVATARKEVEAFYAQHADLLLDQLPEALFRANMQSHFPDGISPEQAWVVSRDFIAQLQPMLAQGRERKKALAQAERRKKEKVRELQAQIDQLRERIVSVTSGPIDDEDFREKESANINKKIGELEAKKLQIETSDE